MLRALDTVTALLAGALGSLLLLAQARGFFAGEPWEHPLANLFVLLSSLACMWLSVRAWFPRERAQ